MQGDADAVKFHTVPVAFAWRGTTGGIGLSKYPIDVDVLKTGENEA